MQAVKGDKVKVNFTLKDANGKVLESSKDTAPMEFTIGEGKVIPGFEKRIIGMTVGESKTITIPPEEAYGKRDEKKVFEFGREKTPPGFNPQIGQQVRMHRPDGTFFTVTVIEVTDKGFIMDANHPLAGKELTFDLELVEIAS